MQPQTPQPNKRPPAPQPYQRSAPSVAPPQRGANTRPEQREAAARVIHQQIDRIYDQDSPHKATEDAIHAQQQAAQPQQQEIPTSYDHTHSNSHDYAQVSTESLQQYHSAWQNYYQKYYEHYYTQQLHASRNRLQAHVQQATQSQSPQQSDTLPQALTKKEAVEELRGSLRDKVKQQAEKARKSRHFMPIACAGAVALVFVFLQYNRQMVATVQAYVSPGLIEPQNIVVDPTASTAVSDEPRLIIPKINVDAPVVYGLKSIAENEVQAKLNEGVVHYPIPGANSVPGQAGNTAILGHSSNDVFNTGAYKFVFVQLDQLQEGDTFYAHYKGTRYTYSVTKKEVIDPTEINKLVLDTKKPVMTLITCTPPGTALKRLIVYADQISPDPAKANSAPQQADKKDPEEIPDYYAPTIFERLFGG